MNLLFYFFSLICIFSLFSPLGLFTPRPAASTTATVASTTATTTIAIAPTRLINAGRISKLVVRINLDNVFPEKTVLQGQPLDGRPRVHNKMGQLPHPILRTVVFLDSRYHQVHGNTDPGLIRQHRHHCATLTSRKVVEPASGFRIIVSRLPRAQERHLVERILTKTKGPEHQ